LLQVDQQDEDGTHALGYAVTADANIETVELLLNALAKAGVLDTALKHKDMCGATCFSPTQPQLARTSQAACAYATCGASMIELTTMHKYPLVWCVVRRLPALFQAI
jgi:hypothetical protein